MRGHTGKHWVGQEEKERREGLAQSPYWDFCERNGQGRAMTLRRTRAMCLNNFSRLLGHLQWSDTCPHCDLGQGSTGVM